MISMSFSRRTGGAMLDVHRDFIKAESRFSKMFLVLGFAFPDDKRRLAAGVKRSHAPSFSIHR
jgi:hypothetical protein